tara:strand:+ start:37 stop:294 length:258 start_codon:yes stop_codon:yes gene_type:complete
MDREVRTDEGSRNKEEGGRRNEEGKKGRREEGKKRGREKGEKGDEIIPPHEKPKPPPQLLNMYNTQGYTLGSATSLQTEYHPTNP